MGGMINWKNIPSRTIELDGQDASTIAVTGTAVTQWSDKSGNANHAVQATAVRQPKYVASAINGYPAIQGRHDGSNGSQLDITDNATLNYAAFTAYTVFQRVTDLGTVETLAAKYVTTGNQREWWQSTTSADDFNTSVSSDGSSAALGNGPVSGASLATPYILRSSFGNAAIETAVNGGTPASSAFSGVFNGTGKYTLFSRPDFADPCASYIGEHLFFTRYLTSIERFIVTQYLKKKWGIA